MSLFFLIWKSLQKCVELVIAKKKKKRKKNGIFSIPTSWMLSNYFVDVLFFQNWIDKKSNLFILKLKQIWHCVKWPIIWIYSSQYRIIKMQNNLKASNSSCQYYTTIVHSGKEIFQSIWKEVHWTSNHLNWPWKSPVCEINVSKVKPISCSFM